MSKNKPNKQTNKKADRILLLHRHDTMSIPTHQIKQARRFDWWNSTLELSRPQIQRLCRYERRTYN
jgi:hypothetical protein